MTLARRAATEIVFTTKDTKTTKFGVKISKAFVISFEKRGPWSPGGGENPPFSLPGDERKIMNHFVAKTILF